MSSQPFTTCVGTSSRACRPAGALPRDHRCQDRGHRRQLAGLPETSFNTTTGDSRGRVRITELTRAELELRWTMLARFGRHRSKHRQRGQ